MNTTTSGWQSVSDTLHDDTSLLTAVREEYLHIYTSYFADELDINHQLPILTHAFRRLEQWRVFLLLTPWMLARLFVPDDDPGIQLPPEWLASACVGREYQMLGPSVELALLTGKQRAHLNYSPLIGHYLLHPLILSMSGYTTPEEVFSAWNRVIQARNQNLERMHKRNPLQEEITRRELFSGLFRGK